MTEAASEPLDQRRDPSFPRQRPLDIDRKSVV